MGRSRAVHDSDYDDYGRPVPPHTRHINITLFIRLGTRVRLRTCTCDNISRGRKTFGQVRTRVTYVPGVRDYRFIFVRFGKRSEFLYTRRRISNVREPRLPLRRTGHSIPVLPILPVSRHQHTSTGRFSSLYLPVCPTIRIPLAIWFSTRPSIIVLGCTTRHALRPF